MPIPRAQIDSTLLKNVTHTHTHTGDLPDLHAHKHTHIHNYTRTHSRTHAPFALQVMKNSPSIKCVIILCLGGRKIHNVITL